MSQPFIFQRGYYWENKIFLTSVSLDIYTHLASGGKTASILAKDIGANEYFLGRLLDALVAMELLTCKNQTYYNSAQVADVLVKSSPLYMGELMLLQDAEWKNWGELETIIRTGKSIVNTHIFKENPERAKQVLHILNRMAWRVAPDLAAKLNLSTCQRLLDVGGGAGTFSIAFCNRYPALRATVWDLPETLKTTQHFVNDAKMCDRITWVGGDFNTDPIPEQFDAVFLSDVLHYQTSDGNAALIKKLYHAVHPGGQIIVKDMFISDDEGAPGWNAIFSIHMMVYSHAGQCYKASALRRWLEEAGFHHMAEIERNVVFTALR